MKQIESVILESIEAFADKVNADFGFIDEEFKPWPNLPDCLDACTQDKEIFPEDYGSDPDAFSDGVDIDTCNNLRELGPDSFEQILHP